MALSWPDFLLVPQISWGFVWYISRFFCSVSSLMVSPSLISLPPSCPVHSPLPFFLSLFTFVCNIAASKNSLRHGSSNLSLACRGGLPRRTGPRCLPETARLRGVPNPGEGLPPRVSGQLPGGSRRTGHLLHPPPQQTQEIHLPVHWRLFFRPGSGEGGQVRLYKVFLIKKKKIKKGKKKRQHPQQISSPPDMFYVPARLTWPPSPSSKEKNPSPSTAPRLPSPTLFSFLKTLKKAKKTKRNNKKREFLFLSVLDWWSMLPRWGCLNCIVKYKNRLIFYYEVEKKTKKKKKHKSWLFPYIYFFLCWSWWLQWCATLSLPWRTDRSLTADRLL